MSQWTLTITYSLGEYVTMMTKTLRSVSIWHQSRTLALDWCLIDANLRVVAIREISIASIYAGEITTYVKILIFVHDIRSLFRMVSIQHVYSNNCNASCCITIKSTDSWFIYPNFPKFSAAYILGVFWLLGPHLYIFDHLRRFTSWESAIWWMSVVI